MTTTQAIRKTITPKKSLPKPGKRKTFEEASASVIKKYGEVFAKLAK
ncbi:MAG: hypothetical protein FWD61_18630 [Phycisphaerales bacterium]|nr:hypothetical protein [Phycisphaerales bacterium]